MVHRVTKSQIQLKRLSTQPAKRNDVLIPATVWLNLENISERSQPYILSDSVYMMLLKRQTYRNRNQQNSGCLGWGRVDSKAAVWGTVVGNGTIPCLSMRADTRLYVFVRIYRTVYQEKQILLHVNFMSNG